MPPQDGWPPPQPGTPPPYGPPPGGFPQYSGQQPPGFPQGPWPQQPAPPPKGNSTKWLLVAIAVLLVIVATIGATLLFTRDGGSDASGPPESAAPSDIASANDTGPVSIITEEPTCKAFNTIQKGLADIQSRGWGEMRAGLGPASSWTPEQRSQVESVATAMRNSAVQVIPLAKQTPHRVVREIYEQFIAYSKAYASRVADYKPADDGMASVTVSAGNAMSGICNAIELGSTSRSLSLPPEGPPTQTGPPVDPAAAEPFITKADSTCTDWVARLDKFNAESPAAWQTRDGGLPGSQWPPERKALEQSVRPQLTTLASEMSATGRNADNSVLADFALTAALYINAYVAAGDDYTTPDGWLVYTGFRVANLIAGACHSVAG